MANRHMHAYVVDKSGAICITDLTFKKTFRIKDALDLAEPLLNHAALPPGLSNCILIAYHWDLAVVQVFHRTSVCFYICNLSAQSCIYRYTLCPCERRRPGLCEAYFTSDRSILILKVSDVYYSLFPTAVESLDPSFIEIVRMDCKPPKSNHYVFPGPEITPFSVCPDPDIPTEVYIGFWKVDISCPMAVFSSGVDISVFDLRRFSSSAVQRHNDTTNGRFHYVDTTNGRFHYVYNYSSQITLATIDRSRLVNIQIPRNSNFLFQSTASIHSGPNSLPKAVRTYTITTVLKEKKTGGATINLWNYDSYTGAQLDWPKLSPSGGYAFVGNEIVLPPNIGRLKSLSRMCVDLLTELVLPEDIQLLPLPEKLKDLIKYGGIR